MDDEIISALLNLGKALSKLGDQINDMMEALAEGFGTIYELIEDSLAEIIEKIKTETSQRRNVRKWPPVRSTVKPYQVPPVKVRPVARSNLRSNRMR